jgi:hypothetical protein
MPDPKQKQQSDAEQIEQLNMVATAYISRQQFKPGDLVVRRAATLPAAHRGPDVRSIAVVLETVDSLREFMDDKTLTSGQGLLLCFTDHRGEIATIWIGAWQYEPAPGDLIAGFAGHRSH